MKRISAIILLGFLTLLACEESNDPEACAQDIVCTEQFVTFTYSPLDSENQPIILSSYYSQNLENGNIYNLGQNFSESAYPIISDAEMDEVKKNGTIIRFFGEKDGQVIIQEDFLIGHDCCHIEPLQGPGIGN